MEGDPQHAEILTKQLELEDCAGLSTDNDIIDPRKLTEEDVEELNKSDASLYWVIAAWCNYLSIDRSDSRYWITEYQGECPNQETLVIGSSFSLGCTGKDESCE